MKYRLALEGLTGEPGQRSRACHQQFLSLTAATAATELSSLVLAGRAAAGTVLMNAGR